MNQCSGIIEQDRKCKNLKTLVLSFNSRKHNGIYFGIPYTVKTGFLLLRQKCLYSTTSFTQNSPRIKMTYIWKFDVFIFKTISLVKKWCNMCLFLRQNCFKSESTCTFFVKFASFWLSMTQEFSGTTRNKCICQQNHSNTWNNTYNFFF